MTLLRRPERPAAAGRRRGGVPPCSQPRSRCSWTAHDPAAAAPSACWRALPRRRSSRAAIGSQAQARFRRLRQAVA